MTEYLTLGSAIDGILAHEPCDGKDEALIVLGLRALLAAIGVVPEYRLWSLTTLARPVSQLWPGPGVP